MATSTPAPAAPKSVFKLCLIFLCIALSFAFVVLLSLLAIDAFTIPYLTPFAHFLAWILRPFVPLLAPLTLGAFLKICKHETFPGKKLWMFITGSWVMNHVARVCSDSMRLWNGGLHKEGPYGMCGLNECKGEWVQAVLIAVVVIGTWRGWKWDAGLVDRWVAETVKTAIAQEKAKQAKKAAQDLENGVVVEEPIVETVQQGGEKQAWVEEGKEEWVDEKSSLKQNMV